MVVEFLKRPDLGKSKKMYVLGENDIIFGHVPLLSIQPGQNFMEVARSVIHVDKWTEPRLKPIKNTHKCLNFLSSSCS